MRIAFYAPLKAPDHAVPSGDREMARLLIRALGAAGHDVRLASRLRSYARDPAEAARRQGTEDAVLEARRLAAEWVVPGAWRPDLWFTYHLYYKAPDRLGPALSRSLAIPYVIAEASYAAKRDEGAWGPWQAEVVEAVRNSDLNLCYTARDRMGLERIGDRRGRFADLPAFIDPDEIAAPAPAGRSRPGPLRLVTVAMMRPGDKLESYRMLGRALAELDDVDWTLCVIGDGPSRREVGEAFAGVPSGRISWRGEIERARLGALLADADVYVWPGFGEAFGLAYLEAQCCGLPVVAQRTAGVPEVVRDGETGLLTAPGDVEAFAAAIRSLAGDPARRAVMASAARRFVAAGHSIAVAAARLGELLAPFAPAVR